MRRKFETTMSSKGQVVISKQIREELGLKARQRFFEKRIGNEILLRPVLPISSAGGILKGMETKPTKEVIKEVKKGWK